MNIIKIIATVTFVLIMFSCSARVEKTIPAKKIDTVSVAVKAKEAELFEAAMQLSKQKINGDSINYTNSKNKFKKALKDYIQLKNFYSDKTVHLQQNGTTIIIPVQVIQSSDSLFMPNPDSSISILWEEFGAQFKGEILDLLITSENNETPDKLLALYEDSLVYFSRDNLENSTILFPPSEIKHNTAIPLTAGLFWNTDTNKTTITFITSSLKKPLMLTQSSIKPSRYSVKTDSLNNSVKIPVNFGSSGNKDLTRCLRQIPGTSKYVFLDGKGFLHLRSNNSAASLWISERAWGNRLFLLDSNIIAVCNTDHPFFIGFEYSGNELKLLGKSPNFDGNISALCASNKQIVISVVKEDSAGEASSKIYLFPKQFLQWTKSFDLPEPVYPDYNSKFIFVPGAGTYLTSPDWHEEIPAIVWRNIYETLFRVKDNKEPIPVLVEKTVSNLSKTRWQFHLKQNIMFADKSLLTAYEVIKIWQKNILNCSRQHKHSEWLWKNIIGVDDFIKGETKYIRGIEAVDGFTVQVNLNLPVPNFAAHLTTPCFGISKKVKNKKFPVGTGPYEIEELQKNLPDREGESAGTDESLFSVSLKRNPYCHSGIAPIKDLIFAFKVGNTINFLTNSSDRGGVVRKQDDINYFRKIESSAVSPSAKEVLHFLALNPASVPLELRNKIASALNREETAKIITEAECRAADYLVSNTGKVNPILKDSINTSAGKRLSINYFRGDPVGREIANRLSLRLSQLNIPYKIPVGLSANAFRGILQQGKYDIIIDYYTPLFANDVYNLIQILSRKYELTDDIKNNFNTAIYTPNKATAIELEKKLMEEALLYPIVYSKNYFVLPSDMLGISYYNIGDINFSKAWMPVK